MDRAMMGILVEAGMAAVGLYGDGYHDFACWGPHIQDFYYWLADGWQAGARPTPSFP
jgi:hypothetical protein